MSLRPEQLRNKALLALEDALQELRYRKVRRSAALRFTLAYLWTCSRGDRAPFDEFWHALASTTPWRIGTADGALRKIYREVGVDRDEDLPMRMWKRAQAEFNPIDANGMPLLPRTDKD